MLAKQTGFTLIETLIAASIVLIIIPVSFMKMSAVSNDQKLDYFIEELLETLQEAQMTAISEKRLVQVTLDSAAHQIIVDKNLESEKIPFNEKIQVHKGTHKLTIAFLSNGHIGGKAGSMSISLGKTTYKLVILIGQGRYYVQKQ